MTLWSRPPPSELFGLLVLEAVAVSARDSMSDLDGLREVLGDSVVGKVLPGR